MKGLSTWVWIMGGVVLAMIVLSIFFTVLARLTVDRHKQDSLESFSSIVTSINTVCDFRQSRSILETITLSDLTKNIYASDDYEMRVMDEKTSGKNLCLNFSGEITCKTLNCEIVMNYFSTEKPLRGLINKITGNIGYDDYQVKVFSEDDKVHVTIGETTTTIPTATYVK